MQTTRLFDRNRFVIYMSVICTLTLGIQAQAATKTWVGGTSDWGTGSNWSPIGVPTSSDDVVFPGSAIVVLGSAASVANLTVGAGANVSLTTNGTLTVTGTTTLGAGSEIDLDGTPTVSLQLDGPITFAQGNSSLDPTQIHSTTGVIGTMKTVKLGTTATVSMAGMLHTWFGEGINTWITRPTGLLLTDARFNDDITIDCQTNFNPGDKNVWLGKEAVIMRSQNNNQNQYFITFTSSTTATGMVIKDLDYWKTGGTWTGGNFEWQVGCDKVAAVRIDVNYARELDGFTTPSWNGPTEAEPFRGVGVRTVNLVHPENQATNSYRFYWVVQPIGLDQDNGPGFPDYVAPANDICYEVEFHPGYIQGSPKSVYSARYSDNFEQAGVGGGNWYSDGSDSTATGGSGRVFVKQCPATGFGDITIGTGTDPVPVELISFSARHIDDAVRLTWETATELNNYGFAVERSTDAENWEVVAFVPGSGTSFSPKRYEHADALGDDLARLPQLAYRLRQIDRDGTTDFSNIVFVKLGELPADVELYAAYPNPFNPATTISFAIRQPANVTLKVYNTFGQEVATLLRGSAMDAGLHTVAFSGDRLPSGVYMAVLEADGALQQQKLVLNK